MSTEQSLNPELIEQTKQQIRSLVAEISQLSRSADIAPEEFYAEFLNRVVQALAAVGGAVWIIEDEGRLTLKYQINLQKSGLRENEEGQRQHGRLLHRAMSGGEALLVPPHSGVGDEDDVSNPTDFLLVLGPLKTDLEVVGVVEILQRPETGVSAQRGYLRFLGQMCDLAVDFVKSRQLRHFSDRQVLWSQLEDFTRRVHETLNPYETAYTIANEGRRLIECDRVSVAIRRGRKCKIEAVSGQDLFDKRSNTVRLLGQLATRVVETGEAVWYTGDTSNMAPQVEDAVQEYVDESHSKTVAVLPLVRPELTEEQRDPEKVYEPHEPVGALIVERIEDSRIPETMVHRVAVVAEHSSIAIANAMEHQNLFLMPVWRAIGKTRWVFRARTLPKTVAISIGVVALVLCLVFVPWPYKVHADGTLEPQDRSHIYARVDGTVKRICVQHDDPVRKGDLLVELDNPDIEVQTLEKRKELQSVSDKIRANHLKINNRKYRDDEEREQLSSEMAELATMEASLRLQLSLLERKKEDLQIRSPRDGRVVTSEIDLQDLLGGRPVQVGQELMEVNDTAGPWQLEILLPDDRMGQIVHAQNERRTKGLDIRLPVTFILATEPGVEHEGKIRDISWNAEVRGEQGNTVLAKVDFEDTLDKDELKEFREKLRCGAEVKAKVRCGYRSIGYVLFRDLWAWIQSRVLFRF